MAKGDPLGTIFIDFSNLGQFATDVGEAVKPIERLNTAVSKLAASMDKMQGGRSSGIGNLKKIAKSLGEVTTLINTQETQGRRSLENLRSTITTIVKFVDALKVLDNTIGAGGFKNINKFSSIMKTVGSAFAAFDTIKKPTNLVVIQNAVDSLIKVLDAMERAIPRSGRFSKFSRVRGLLQNLADALSAFDKIKSPQNMQYATAGVLALSNVITLLEEKFNFNIIDRINRWRKLGQYANVAKGLAVAISAFDEIKNPGNLEKIAPAINALNRIITSLESVAKSGTKLARGGFMGLFTQQGSLLAGFGTFIKKMSKSLSSLSNFGPKQIASLHAATLMFDSLVTLLGLFATKSDVMLKGGDVIADFSAKDIDMVGFKELLDDLIDIAQYISKARFDPSKISAIGDLFTAYSKLGDLSSLKNLPSSAGGSGGGGGGIFASLKNMASNAINATVNVFRKGASLIASVFKGLFAQNPFKQLLTHAQQTLGHISQSLRSFGRELSQTGMQLLATGGVAGFLQSQQVGMAMDFEAIMKQIEVLGGVVGDELSSAEQLILQLGESSVFSATEVAAAFLDLSKAGLSVDQISASMEDMLNLAAAGEISVADASNLVINAVGAMGLGFEDATMIANTFVAAANVGVASVADLSAAFGYVGNTAGAMGQELDVVTAALTLMIDKGIESTRAGTALDAFMRSLINPSEDASEAIRAISTQLYALEATEGTLSKMGISFEGDLAGLITDAEGNYRDLNDIIRLVTIATEDWDESMRVSTLAQLSGSANAARAILALTGTYEDGSYVLDQYIDKQAGSASAAEVGAALMDTTRGALEELSGAFETLLLKALQPVLEYGIRPMIDGFTFLVRQISKLPQPLLAGVAAFVGLSTVMITITGAFMLFSGIITQLIGFGLVPLVGMLWSLANPLKFILALTAGKGILFALFGGALFIVPLIMTVVGAIKAFKSGLSSLSETASGQSILGSFETALITLKWSVETFLQVGARFLNLIWKITSPSDTGGSTGLVAFIIMQVTTLINTVRDAIIGVSDLLDMLNNLAFAKIPGIGDIIPKQIFSTDTGGDIASNPLAFGDWQNLVQAAGETGGLSREAFAEAFGAPLSDLSGAFGFDQAKDWLVMNSTDYDNEIAKLHEMADAAGGFTSELGIGGADVSFLKKRNKIAQTTSTITKELRSMDEVLKYLDEDSKAFKTLSANLEPFTDNPIIELIFGKDVTGEQLARNLSQLITALSNLRTIGSRSLRTFAMFFEDLRNGEGIVQSFKNLIKGLVVDAGMLASVFLDVTTSILGIGGFESLIANLASGNLRGALSDFLKIVLDALVDTAQGILNTMGKVISWAWGKLLDFEDTIVWADVFQTLVDGAVAAWNGFIKPTLIWSWGAVLDVVGTVGDIKWSGAWDSIIQSLTNFFVSKGIITSNSSGQGGIAAPRGGVGPGAPVHIQITSLFGLIGAIDWQNVWDKVKPTLDSFVVDKVVIPLADIFSIELPTTTQRIEGDSIIPETFTTTDYDSILGTVSKVTDTIATFVGNLADALSGPGVEIISDTLTNIGNALKSLTNLDPAALGVLGASMLIFTPILSAFIGVIAVPVLTVVTALAFINGIASAIPELVEALNSFASADVSGGFDHLGNAIEDFAGGAADTLLTVIDFVATLFGVDNVFTQENYKQGIEGLNTALESIGIIADMVWRKVELGFLGLLKSITEGIEGGAFGDLLGYIGVNVDIGSDKIQEKIDELKAKFATEDLSVKLGVSVEDLGAAVDQAKDFFNRGGAGADPTAALMPAESIFNSDEILGQLELITASAAVTGNIRDMLTGKQDNTPLLGVDVMDTGSIQGAATEAQSSLVNFSDGSVAQIQILRNELQGIATDLSSLAVNKWLISISAVSDTQGPAAEPRAKGGPVFADKLYEVAENGIAELLNINNKTYLIPGQKGYVIAPSDPSGGLVPNTNYTPQAGAAYGGGGNMVYEDHSSLVIQVDGSNLSASELEAVTHRIIDKREADRARSIRRRLRATGRS